MNLRLLSLSMMTLYAESSRRASGRGQAGAGPTVSAPSAAGTSPVKRFARSLILTTRPASAPPAWPKVTPSHAVTGLLSSHSQGLTLVHFSAQHAKEKKTLGHIAHVKAQLEHLRDTSLTLKLNLSTFGTHPRVKAQLEHLRDTSLTLKLNLSTFGTHPRVTLGHM